jgi:hypothetical protein
MVSLLWNLNPAKILMSEEPKTIEGADSITGTYNIEQLDFSKKGTEPMTYSYKTEHISVMADIPEPLQEAPEQEQISDAAEEAFTESEAPLQMSALTVDMELVSDSFEEDQIAGPPPAVAEPIRDAATAEPTMARAGTPEPIENAFEPDRNTVTIPREVTATLDVANARKKPLDLSSGFGPLDVSRLGTEVVEPVSPTRPQQARAKVTYV